MQFNFLSTDGKGYDDYAWARLVNADQGNLTVAWLFTARSTNSGPATSSAATCSTGSSTSLVHSPVKESC